MNDENPIRNLKVRMAERIPRKEFNPAHLDGEGWSVSAVTDDWVYIVRDEPEHERKEL